jgi:hypothetical protein
MFTSGRWRRCGRRDGGWHSRKRKELGRLLWSKRTGRSRLGIKNEREYASRVRGRGVTRRFLDGVGFWVGGRWLGLFLLLEYRGYVALGRRELRRE